MTVRNSFMIFPRLVASGWVASEVCIDNSHMLTQVTPFHMVTVLFQFSFFFLTHGDSEGSCDFWGALSSTSSRLFHILVTAQGWKFGYKICGVVFSLSSCIFLCLYLYFHLYLCLYLSLSLLSFFVAISTEKSFILALLSNVFWTSPHKVVPSCS